MLDGFRAGRQPELEQLSIGELAKLAAVSTRTIRYGCGSSGVTIQTELFLVNGTVGR